MKFIRVLLFPLMPVYYLGAWFRNQLFDLGILRSRAFSTPVICVGNLSTGGTGKTPMVEYLIRLLKDQALLAVLSRGYKRKTTGFVLADASSDFKDIGDEPYQYLSKYPEVLIAVDEQRVRGIDKLLSLRPAPQAIVLDDAFQHRYVSAGLNILLTSYEDPFFSDLILPTGNLREPRSGYKRADMIIVTKCPEDLSERERAGIVERINPLEHQSVFFSSIQYAGLAKNIEGRTKALKHLKRFSLLTGIANPKPLMEHLERQGLVFDSYKFSDHHEFTEKDLEGIPPDQAILTTEKDFSRLKELSAIKGREVYYLPIEFKIDCSKAFKEQILSFTRP
jgi:tetraacyldisaccharide 4'-kinase